MFGLFMYDSFDLGVIIQISLDQSLLNIQTYCFIFYKYNSSNKSKYNQIKLGTMSIIYALIAKQVNGDITNLCSFDAAHGNYPTVTYQILKNVKIRQNITYKYNEQYNFHILKDGILLFVALTDSGLKVKSAFMFLEELQKKFKQKYSNEEITLATKYEFSPTFSDIFQAQVAIANNYRQNDKKQILKKQLTQLQSIMSENIDKVLQRQEKVELIVKKTAKLDSIADQIKKNASKIKKNSIWKQHKLKIMIGGLVLAILLGLFILL